MPRACSMDLRERVLAACEAGEGGQAEVARRSRVGERTLSRWLRAARTEGRRGPKVPARKRAPVGGAGAVLADLVAEQGDATLSEYAERLAARVRGAAGGPSTRSGWRRAPACGAALLRCAGRSRAWASCGRKDAPGRRAGPGGCRSGARASWRAELAGIDPRRRLVFIDETGIETRLTRAYGRALRGRRATGKVPWGSWKRLTVIGALALEDGVVASMSIPAATSPAVFLAFVEQVLAGAGLARPAGCHRGSGQPGTWPRTRPQRSARPLTRPGCATAICRPTRPTSTRSSRRAWSKLKTCLRAAGARSREALEAALGPALAAITARDARGWFRLAGYIRAAN